MKENRAYQIIQWVLWGLLILSLPITSFPLIADRLGAMVSPAAIIPLVLLILAWWLPDLIQGGSLPRQSLPLLGFVAVALVSSLISLFREIPPFQDALPWRQVLEGFTTLLIGVAFFLLSSSWPRSEKSIHFTLRLLNYAGLIILVWCIIQWIVWNEYTRWPEWLRDIQKMFSSGTLYKDRITGFAYEPSWLAHQLNMIFIPFWLASTVKGFTVHRRKFLGISLENFLLVGGVILLYLSKSRLGLLAFLLCVSYLLLRLSIKIVRILQARFKTRAAKQWTAITFYLGLVVLSVLLLLGTGVYLSKADPRMSELFDFETLRNRPFLEYAEKLAFSARIVYWQAGWNVFGENPFLGVGLGNAGFYFYDKLDPAAWEYFEIRDVMYDLASPPNIKSLWVRLFAETGFIGSAFFIVWLGLILLSGISLLRQSKKYMQVTGMAVILTLLGLLVEGFSVDTFALPYFWITFGLGVAVFRHQEQAEPEVPVVPSVIEPISQG